MMNWLDTQAVRLWRFGQDTVRPAVPRAAWLLAGIAVFCVLNLLFEQEIWPHHPQTGVWFGVTFIGCVMSLPWLAAYAAARVAWEITGWWKVVWQLATWGLYAAATVSALLFLILCTVALL
ncbi:hypothetical protein ACFPAF_16130 [Hymenobacter endophyticus]|uniref:Transmembrane protein n=1 Tax=Hymenobacter endophyticus TaxID=3076335 RepID=A0ABU3TKP8_9BACT|nr:hypothetical protein [Hymenobacter endophyticus]MDU0371930.1 hypothetical protein [Hymenobacter endophyticus]